MSALDQIININISQQTAAVSQASFSIPLIIGPTNAGWSDFAHVYTSPAGLLTDGFTTSSPEYIYALEMFEQALTPTEFVVGKRGGAAAAQVDHITVNSAVSGHVYSGQIQGQTWSYTASGGDTTTTIAAAIAAAISALSAGVVTATSSVAVVTVTAVTAGFGFTDQSTDTLITIANITPNSGLQADINNVIGENNLWYGLVLAAGTDSDILQGAALIESLKKIFIAISSTSAIATTASTDLASVLKGKAYKRTGLLYSPEANEGKDAAWVGGQLPATPGSNNWAYKTLVGCTPDVLTANQQSILIGDPVAQIAGKNANLYQTVGGVPITQMGTMAGGQYIDITIGVDWLFATLQQNVYGALVSAVKIPYTDKGVGILISAVKAAIDLGVVNGLIDGDSPITITAQPVLSVPISQRANRVSPTISFSCRLAGAINAVVIQGTVTV